MKKIIKNIIDKIVGFFKNIIGKIVEFFKSQTRETNIKIAAVSAAIVLTVIVLIVALGRDDNLFPEQDWENPNSTQEEITTTEATTEPGTTADPTLGEWLPVN